jgi:hypothetical protein
MPLIDPPTGRSKEREMEVISNIIDNPLRPAPAARPETCTQRLLPT